MGRSGIIDPFAPVAGGSDTIWTITASSQQDTLAQVSTTLQADGVSTAPDSWSLTKPSASSSTVTGSGHTVTYTPDVVGVYILEATIGTEIVASTVQVGDDAGYYLLDMTGSTFVGQVALKGTNWAIGEQNRPCVASGQNGYPDGGRDCAAQLLAVAVPADRISVSVRLKGLGSLSPIELTLGSAGAGPILTPAASLSSNAGYYSGVQRTNYSTDQDRLFAPRRVGQTSAVVAPSLDEAGGYEPTLHVTILDTSAEFATSSIRDASGNVGAEVDTNASAGVWGATVYVGFWAGSVAAAPSELDFGSSVEVWVKWE